MKEPWLIPWYRRTLQLLIVSNWCSVCARDVRILRAYTESAGGSRIGGGRQARCALHGQVLLMSPQQLREAFKGSSDTRD